MDTTQIVSAMETGKIGPLKGYKMLRQAYARMTDCERTTDACRAMVALEDVDNTSWAERVQG
jgi:hypothetical protein